MVLNCYASAPVSCCIGGVRELAGASGGNSLLGKGRVRISTRMTLEKEI